MKSEHKIAKANIGMWKKHTDKKAKEIYYNIIKNHIASCQREEKFLKGEINNPYFWRDRKTTLNQNVERLIYNLQERLKDHQSAIEEYKGAGIK